MDSDQYQLGKTKVFIKNPESVSTHLPLSGPKDIIARDLGTHCTS